MSNGSLFKVPPFQRDYSWNQEEWDDLWRDLEELSEGNEQEHYMGYLVLQSRDSKHFDIIDGQQRLTTLSITILAVLANLQRLIDAGNEPDRNELRLKSLRSTFIGYLDPVTLITSSKLTLNRNNNNLYQTYLVPLQALPKRGLNASEHLMRKAFDWWVDKLKTHCKDGVALAQFVETLSNKLIFTAITVADELNAYKVFETLNARGVKLSSTDLLKNYLFSVVHRQKDAKHELNALEEKWEKLVGGLGAEDFPTFLRTYWNSRHRFLRQTELFKRIRDQITDQGQVFELLRNLDQDVDVYVALGKPEDPFWQPEQREYIRLLKMFSVRQVYALLLAAYRNLNDPKDFTTLLRVLAVISFRYNVICNLPPNDQEVVYHKLAEKIEKEKLSLSSILIELKPLHVEDKVFKSHFSSKELKTTQSRNKKIVRYILFELEKSVSNKQYDPDSDAYMIEHILPQNPGEGWDDFDDSELAQFVYRLGNMTLVQTKQNNVAANLPFADKRTTYAASEFEITQRLAAHNSEWTPKRITNHQEWMADQATAIWRVSQFD